MTGPIVVIGAGLAGAAAAWRLAAQGREVVLVEAVAPAHVGGSSHGSARIFRHAYPDPFWVDLTVRALDGWHELEAAIGRSVLTTTGGLDFGPRHDLPAVAAAMAACGVGSELLPPQAARERWPHLAVDGPVLHHTEAGVIDAAVAVEAMVAEAQRHGARLLLDRVVAVEVAFDGATVTLEQAGPLSASTAVVAAGAWLPEIAPRLPAAIADRLPPLVVTQQQVFHFPFPEPPARPEDWPVFIHQGEHMVYSLPGGRDAGGAGFKIAEHDAGILTTASTRDGVVDPASRARVVDLVRRLLPAVDPSPYAETTCLYTSTPTEDFVIDRVGPVVIASPCSGHGAKFAPLIGDLIAAAVAGDEPIPRFRLR
ncbi:FAD-dependent oxidoreductase [Amnibacterium setariae]|uniref:FAD-dependent oxidoreductase n=1 Tax=Amnibacterium setariae TaxID=2306585 RepID=UPI001F3E7B57|nr:FAD-dependent oxidoreductase [Amnibacterium setariae]